MSKFNWTAFRTDLETLTGHAVSERDARLVRHRLAAYQTIQEAACNGELTSRQKAVEANLERNLKAFFGPRLDHFNGDPRGACVKLTPLDTWAGPRLTYFAEDWGNDLVFVGA
jgi:hypothetical protein